MTKGKALFMREVELKHCRLAMLAALGFPIAEQSEGQRSARDRTSSEPLRSQAEEPQAARDDARTLSDPFHPYALAQSPPSPDGVSGWGSGTTSLPSHLKKHGERVSDLHLYQGYFW